MKQANFKSSSFPRFMADFETLTGKDVVDETYVWASGVCSIDNPYNDEYLKIWNSDEPLYEFLSQFKMCECYFHNLKFDGHFILTYLENHGFVYDDDLSREKSYSTLITGDGQWYMIRVRWMDADPVLKVKTQRKKMKDGTIKEYEIKEKIKGKHSNKRITEFRDSLKKIPLPLRDIPKAYGIPMNKLTIDYTKYRERNGELTDEEIAYLKADLQIPALALQNDIIKESRSKLTASADALDDFKSRNPLYLRKIKYRGHKISDFKMRDECFRKLFPCLDQFTTDFNETYDTFCRRSYKGGWTYYKYDEPQIIGDGLVFDVNSLYPSVMYECSLPYGKPHYYHGKYEDLDPLVKQEYPLFICHILCEFRIKEHHLPCIQIKGNFRFGGTEYLKSSGTEPVELYLTSVDLKLYQDQYDFNIIKYIDGIAFKSKIGMFKNYIDYWSHIKIEAGKSGNKGLRSLAKRMLNSLYGKFGTNPDSSVKHPYLDENGIISFFGEDGDARESIYTPIASFTTAWARNKTIRSAQCNYDRFYYADTDSIHLSGLEPPKENELFHIHESDLGKWKCEMVFHKAKYVRAKTYLESPYLKNGKVVENPSELDESCVKSDHPEVKCAGMPDNCKSMVTYDNFEYGAEFEGKLMPKRIKGGVVLRETTYQIKEGKIF